MMKKKSRCHHLRKKVPVAFSRQHQSIYRVSVTFGVYDAPKEALISHPGSNTAHSSSNPEGPSGLRSRGTPPPKCSPDIIGIALGAVGGWGGDALVSPTAPPGGEPGEVQSVAPLPRLS